MAFYRLFLYIEIVFIVASIVVTVSENENDGHGWDFARATFYGDDGGTTGGACGFDKIYGLETTALSDELFSNAEACGACFQIACVNAPQSCIPGYIRVTATDRCPPGGWCTPPQKHFDLSKPMFVQIAKQEAGVVPIVYRRVKCGRLGGIKFKIGGNPFWMLVLVFNVGGIGDVTLVKIKGSSRLNWTSMSRNWGQNWQTWEKLQGQSLSFQVTTSDGWMVECDTVANNNWQFGQTYKGCNFK